MCTRYIYRHIRSLPPTQIFTTRHMLIYGSRAAVDSALRKMVNHGFIFRLARGVFVRDTSEEPSLGEIVEAKMNAYRTKITANPESVLHKMGLYQFGNSNTFAKNGSSSSFWTIRGRAYLRNICERKMSLCQSLVGQLVYALWFLGTVRSRSTPRAIYNACKNFGRIEKELFWLASSLMPSWLTGRCDLVFPRRRVMKENPFLANLSDLR